MVGNTEVLVSSYSPNKVVKSRFLADQMSEILYAKKSLGKIVIPLVIGTSRKWTQTTAGMLLAGQLYIQFANEDLFDEKISELLRNLEKLVVSSARNQSNTESSRLPNVFLSYCWTNSKISFEAEQIPRYIGHS